jgi:hypothetical protein
MEVSVQLQDQTALPLEKSPVAHRIRSWVGSRAALGDLEKRNICFPARIRTPNNLDHSLVAIPAALFSNLLQL